MSTELPTLSVEQIRGLEKSYRNAARWFFLIAGISLLNVLGLFFNFPSGLVAGLGANFYIYGFMETFLPQLGVASSLIPAITFGINLVVVGIFTAIGWLAYRRHLWAYTLGMVLYGLDTLIYIRVWSWTAIILHVIALFFLFTGRGSLIALGKLKNAGKLPTDADELRDVGNTAPIPADTLLAIMKDPTPAKTEPFEWKIVGAGLLVFVVPILLVGFVLWLLLTR